MWSSRVLKFLVHKKGDDVGVAVEDIQPGESAVGVFMDTDETMEVKAQEAIPFGHKIALRPLAENAPVLKYGVRIGLTCQKIAAGEHVHVHNIRSERW